jgi:APA family basic amino acid/polyamine antiporter
MSSTKLSLRSAIFINLNIILGTGIFINSVLLARHAGPWGALTYMLVGTLLLPLILALAELVKIHKGGSFYDYAAPLHPFVGFMSQWSYFVGKMAACALGVHIFVSLLKTIFIPLQDYPSIMLDSLVIGVFIALNMLNLRINRSIQILFFILKMVPILFVIISGIIFFSPTYIINQAINWNDFFVTIPFALYAFTGFEATCSLIHTLQNPEKDGPRAILYSYGMSVLIAVLFQTLLYVLVGPQLRIAGTFLETFPLVFKTLFSDGSLFSTHGALLIHVAIACSALGAAYGVMFSNAWNLFTLAEKRLIYHPTLFTRLTKGGVPYLCVIVEGTIALVYLWYTQGNQVALQQVNTLALTTTFSLSVLGLIAYLLKKNLKLTWVCIGATLSCSLLLGFLIKNFMHYQALPILPFLLLIAFGIVNFLTNFKQHQRA